MKKKQIGNAILSSIISRLKKYPYKLDPAISGFDMLSELFYRGRWVIRGLFYKPFFKQAQFPLFIGKHVCIRFKNHIRIGACASIANNANINALCRKEVVIGSNFKLGEHGIIECSGVISELGEELVIGDNVGISANAFLGVRGRVEIGQNTIIGPYFSLHSENHTFSDCSIPIKYQPTSRKGIVIGENCWIGAKVTILDGVTIGNDCVISAGAVVTHSFPDNQVIGGVPARVLKERR